VRKFNRILVAILCCSTMFVGGDRMAFAQAGSTGGTIGKTDKSVSGGEEQAEQKPHTGSLPHRMKNETHSTGNNCRGISGVWEWHSKLPKFDVTFKSGGAVSATNGLTATWSCSNGTFLIKWLDGFTDHMQLSSNGKELSGTSWAGNPISATRR